MLIKKHLFLILVFTVSGSELVLPNNKRYIGSSHSHAELTMHSVWFKSSTPTTSPKTCMEILINQVLFCALCPIGFY